MADQNRNITVVNVFVHQNRVTSVRGSQIYQMIVILAVVSEFPLPAKPVLQGETTECESDYPLHPPKLESGGCKSNGTVFVYDDLANSLS